MASSYGSRQRAPIAIVELPCENEEEEAEVQEANYGIAGDFQGHDKQRQYQRPFQEKSKACSGPNDEAFPTCSALKTNSKEHNEPSRLAIRGTRDYSMGTSPYQPHHTHAKDYKYEHDGEDKVVILPTAPRASKSNKGSKNKEKTMVTTTGQIVSTTKTKEEEKWVVSPVSSATSADGYWRKEFPADKFSRSFPEQGNSNITPATTQKVPHPPTLQRIEPTHDDDLEYQQEQQKQQADCSEEKIAKRASRGLETIPNMAWYAFMFICCVLIIAAAAIAILFAVSNNNNDGDGNGTNGSPVTAASAATADSVPNATQSVELNTVVPASTSPTENPTTSPSKSSPSTVPSSSPSQQPTAAPYSTPTTTFVMPPPKTELERELIPLGRYDEVTRIDLSDSGLSGSLPTELGMYQQLSYLHLGSNDLIGTLPTELGTLSMLEHINVWGNDITGTIPTEFGLMQKLTYLSISQNDLTGTIPSELGMLQQLTLLNLGMNDLSGEVPSTLGMLTDLEYLGLELMFDLKGTLPEEICALTNIGLLFVNDCNGGIVCPEECDCICLTPAYS